MTDKAKWLAGLKVGDPVVVMSTHIGNRHGHLTAVARFTPTQIVTEAGSRFRRKDGKRTGVAGYESAWLKETTAERETAIKAERTLRQVETIRWRDVPIATLEAVVELVSKAGKAKR